MNHMLAGLASIVEDAGDCEQQQQQQQPQMQMIDGLVPVATPSRARLNLYTGDCEYGACLITHMYPN